MSPISAQCQPVCDEALDDRHDIAVLDHDAPAEPGGVFGQMLGTFFLEAYPTG
jgi:hypothetical protein